MVDLLRMLLFASCSHNAKWGTMPYRAIYNRQQRLGEEHKRITKEVRFVEQRNRRKEAIVRNLEEAVEHNAEILKNLTFQLDEKMSNRQRMIEQSQTTKRVRAKEMMSLIEKIENLQNEKEDKVRVPQQGCMCRNSWL